MYHRYLNRHQTPQNQPLIGEQQLLNHAGGYVYEQDQWQKLRRFLLLGSEGGTYYVDERRLTLDNCEAVLACIEEDGWRVVRETVQLSESGRAPRNDPALFVLALCSALGNCETRQHAFKQLPRVARIATHLFRFAQYRRALAGWGRGMRAAVRRWYSEKGVHALAYQVLKYRRREGWSHRDMLRLAHPQSDDPLRNGLYAYLAGKPHEQVPELVQAVQAAEHADLDSLIRLIGEHGLSREMIATHWLKEARVWEALLVNMPMTAMLRNLANMTRVGLLQPGSQAMHTVCRRLGDADRLHKARVHPLHVLTALCTYQQGHGRRSQRRRAGGWQASPQLLDALNAAFYASFRNVENTGRRILIALDVSSSMSWGCVAGMDGLTPAMAAAAMCMITARTEHDYHIVGFADKLRHLGIHARMDLRSVLAKTSAMTFGATDCAQPMIWAQRRGIEVDAFVVYTDNETWAGDVHPVQALRNYRRRFGVDARLIVVGMTSNGFSIADPRDAGMLDVVGFDAAAPKVMADFIRGETSQVNQ